MKNVKKLTCRIIFVITMVLLVVTLFTGCGNKSTQNATLADPFIAIEGQEENGLVYHKESKTVYTLFTELRGGPSYAGYLSEHIVNGHNCEYREDKIMEVIPNYEIVDGKIVEKEPTYKEVN